MPPLVGKGFIVALSLGQNHICGIQHPAGFFRKHLIDCAGNGGAVGDDPGQTVDSRIGRILRCGVVEHDISPDQRMYRLPCLKILECHELIHVISKLDRGGKEHIRRRFSNDLAAEFSLELRAELPAGQLFLSNALLKSFRKHFYIMELEVSKFFEDRISVTLIGKSDSAGSRIEPDSGDTLEIRQGIFKHLCFRPAKPSSA